VLYVLVLDLPPDGRGRAQHWSRTATTPGEAFALYDQCIADHISAPAAE
jgi:hypothetical protein